LKGFLGAEVFVGDGVDVLECLAEFDVCGEGDVGFMGWRVSMVGGARVMLEAEVTNNS
jgi:hypothetical protein